MCKSSWSALASSGNESYLLGHHQQEVPARLFPSRGPECIDRSRSLVFLARDRDLFVGYAWVAARWLVNTSGPLTMRAASWPRRPGPRDDDIRSFGGRLAPYFWADWQSNLLGPIQAVEEENHEPHILRSVRSRGAVSHSALATISSAGSASGPPSPRPSMN